MHQPEIGLQPEKSACRHWASSAVTMESTGSESNGLEGVDKQEDTSDQEDAG